MLQHNVEAKIIKQFVWSKVMLTPNNKCVRILISKMAMKKRKSMEWNSRNMI